LDLTFSFFEEMIQMKKFLVVAVTLMSLGVFSSAQAVDVTLRLLSQGGFRDHRAEDGIVGGGQLGLDVKMAELPIAISVTYEYYTKSPDPIFPYEIAGLVVANALYMRPAARGWWKSNVWLGGGIGTLSVPKLGVPDAMERGILFDLVGGINVRLFWKMGLYIEGKYIYSSKTTDDIKVIDFSDFPVLVGISLNFGW